MGDQMPKPHRPKRGSHGFSPRKRAKKEVPTIKSWPEGNGKPHLQGFAAYKAGMTHAFVIDYRKTSTTAGQEVQVPVTILEAPPLKVCAIRLYREGYEGHQVIKDIWAKKEDLLVVKPKKEWEEIKSLKEMSKKDKKEMEDFNEKIFREIPVKKNANPEKELKKVQLDEVDDVRVLVHTQPYIVKAIPKKKPELMEVRIGGGTIEERLKYAKSILGKEVTIKDFTKSGDMIDVIAVTKGKGFQGHIKRWGLKLLTHKNSKHRRMIGNLGPKSPGYVKSTVPQAGQMGYHKRTEYNKRVLKIVCVSEEEKWESKLEGEKTKEQDKKKSEEAGFAPAGGFLHYGRIHNDYILLHGSVPGPAKRLIRLREAIRSQKAEVVEEPPKIVYLSLSSKQGA